MATASDIRTEHSGIVDRAAGSFTEVGARYARSNTYRATLNELSTPAHRYLRDMGLCRSQLRSIAWEHAYDAH